MNSARALAQFARPGDDRGDVLVRHEEDEGELRVSPRGVGEQLVERLVDRGRPTPPLAVADEDVAVLDADEDVGLACAVERFASGLTLV
jgi:hypothetical protein